MAQLTLSLPLELPLEPRLQSPSATLTTTVRSYPYSPSVPCVPLPPFCPFLCSPSTDGGAPDVHVACISGDLDLFVTNNPGGHELWINDGSGSFAAFSASPAGGNMASKVAAWNEYYTHCDLNPRQAAFWLPLILSSSPRVDSFDGDGDLDLIVPTKGNLEFWRNDVVSSPSWAVPSATGPTAASDNTYAAAWAEYAHYGSNPQLAASWLPLIVSSSPRVDSVDNDGDLDLLVGRSASTSDANTCSRCENALWLNGAWRSKIFVLC